MAGSVKIRKGIRSDSSPSVPGFRRAGAGGLAGPGGTCYAHAGAAHARVANRARAREPVRAQRGALRNGSPSGSLPSMALFDRPAPLSRVDYGTRIVDPVGGVWFADYCADGYVHCLCSTRTLRASFRLSALVALDYCTTLYVDSEA